MQPVLLICLFTPLPSVVGWLGLSLQVLLEAGCLTFLLGGMLAGGLLTEQRPTASAIDADPYHCPLQL